MTYTSPDLILSDNGESIIVTAITNIAKLALDLVPIAHTDFEIGTQIPLGPSEADTLGVFLANDTIKAGPRKGEKPFADLTVLDLTVA